MAVTRTPEELIRLYWDEVWNNRNVELIREICADPIVRHDPGNVTRLSLDEQVARVRQQSVEREPFFTHEVLVADDRRVVSVWNMVTRRGDPIALCGIEVFEAEDGRFTRCWNSSYVPGRWGRDGDTLTVAPPVPIADPAGIDRAWMERVLVHADPALPRLAMLGDVTPIGNGTMSRALRVALTFNGDATSAPASVICKFAPAASDAVALGTAYGMFAREVASYRFFGDDPGVRIPRAWFAACDDSGATTLVLEDVADATPGDQVAGCSAEAAVAVVDELARLHARHLDGEALAALDWPLRRDGTNAMPQTAYTTGAALFAERLGDRLTDTERAIIAGFVPLAAAWSARRPAHRTLLHGDARVDNILFEAGGRACLIDWQLTAIGDPAFDLAYFLTGSLDVADRRACERALIARHAAAVGIDPAQAATAYHANIVAGLQATVGAINGIAASPATDALLLALVRRNCAAVIDWGGLGAFAAAAAAGINAPASPPAGQPPSP